MVQPLVIVLHISRSYLITDNLISLCFFFLDCPQVIAIVSYGATERDELDVKEGDLMNVIVELSDGEFP